MSGPVPKRSDQRRRRNKAEPTTKAPAGDPVEVAAPPALEHWHPLAREWFESLGRSGQAHFYEASDWAQARYIAEIMHRSLQSERVSGQLVSTIFSGMTDLLTTEGARRRVRLELERDKPVEEPAGVAIMKDYRRAAGRK